MTLKVSVSRARGYVLQTGDASVYATDPDAADDAGVPVNGFVAVPPKTERLTAYTVFGAGGCLGIGQDFRERIGSKVRAVDDVEACFAAARETIDELIADDRPGETYHVPRPDGRDDLPDDVDGVRYSIHDRFTLVMTGFRHDGSTLIVQWEPENGFQDYDNPDPAGFEFSCTIPDGVPVDDVAPYYVILSPPSPLGAFTHALAAHRRLHEQHPQRVTRDCAGIFLAWAGPLELPRWMTFEIPDVTDAATRAAVAELLPPFPAGTDDPLDDFGGSWDAVTAHAAEAIDAAAAE